VTGTAKTNASPAEFTALVLGDADLKKLPPTGGDLPRHAFQAPHQVTE
jgi:hypothetical protein